MNGLVGGVEHLQDGPTASRPTYRLIQVLRVVAALMVVIHHAVIVLYLRDGLGIGNWINGGAGVDIFFVISGFVMTVSSAPLRASQHPARIFLARRLERIVPMYWLATTCKVVAVLAWPLLALYGLGTTWHVVVSYLMLPTRLAPVVFVGWTLIYEMMFYVLFAIVLALRAPLLKTIGPVLVVLALLQLAPHLRLPFMVAWYANTIVLDFLYGILLALGLRWVVRMPRELAFPLAMVGMAVLLNWVAPNFSFWRGLLWGVPAAAVVAGALALERSWGPKMPRWLLELGDASYSIYLIHVFVLPLGAIVLAHLGEHWRGVVPVSLVVLVLISTLAGEIVYRLVERPIMRWFKGRRQTAIPANA
jgi:exopolysaccharide production protein ExoZ